MDLIKILKKYITPKIEKISIYKPNKDYMGRSKQSIALQNKHYKKMKCYNKCIKK